MLRKFVWSLETRMLNSKDAELFFSGCTNPVAVTDFVLSLAAGKKIAVTRIPVELLPCVLLFHAVARIVRDEGIVDDFQLLKETIAEELNSSVPRFYHPHGYLVSAMVFNNNVDLEGHRDCPYMFRLFETVTAKSALRTLTMEVK